MTEERHDHHRIAVDFDGVLHSYTSQWSTPEVIPDPPVEGAIDWLNAIVEHFEVVVFTTRAEFPAGQQAVREYLRDHGYTGPALLVTDHKPAALVYLDDRGWRFEGPGTFPTAQQIWSAKPWNRQPPPRLATETSDEFTTLRQGAGPP